MGAAHHRGASNQNVETPPEFIQAVFKKFKLLGFAFDLAASVENAKASQFYTEAQDSLGQPWLDVAKRSRSWLNPPYKNIPKWVEKAAKNKQARPLVLVPASVGTNWYRDWVYPYAKTYILNGRITFIGHKDPFPKDLMLLDYGAMPDPSCGYGIEIWPWMNSL